MHEEIMLSPLVVAGFAALGVLLIACAMLGLCWWITTLVREHNETKRRSGVAVTEFLRELRDGSPEALRRVEHEQERGH